MHRLLHKLVALPLASAIVFAICVCGQARIAQSRSPILAPQTGSNPTVVTLRWASRPGVNRYRLQLAIDSGFEGIVFALNASDGVVVWSVRSSGQVRKSNSAIKYPSPFVTVRSRAGLDNIVLFSQMSAMMLEGRTGRQIWRRSLPRVVSSATWI